MGQFKTLLLITTLSGAVIGLTGCASWGHKDSGRTAGREIDDNHITDRIESALRNEPVYKFNDVDVATYNGVVQLSGFVTAEDQKQRAGQIAQQTPGVAQVVNSISLKTVTDLTPTGRTYGSETSRAPVTVTGVTVTTNAAGVIVTNTPVYYPDSTR